MNEQQQTRLTPMKSAKQILLGGMLAAAVMAVAPSAWTQQINGTPGSPDATVVIDGKQAAVPLHGHDRQADLQARPVAVDRSG